MEVTVVTDGRNLKIKKTSFKKRMVAKAIAQTGKIFWLLGAIRTVRNGCDSRQGVINELRVHLSEEQVIAAYNLAKAAAEFEKQFTKDKIADIRNRYRNYLYLTEPVSNDE